MIPLTPEQSRALRFAGETFVRVEDPETHRSYVLLDSELFDQLSAWFEPERDELCDIRDYYPAMDEALRENWDDPGMDIYNDYRPPSA